MFIAIKYTMFLDNKNQSVIFCSNVWIKPLEKKCLMYFYNISLAAYCNFFVIKVSNVGHVSFKVYPFSNEFEPPSNAAHRSCNWG